MNRCWMAGSPGASMMAAIPMDRIGSISFHGPNANWESGKAGHDALAWSVNRRYCVTGDMRQRGPGRDGRAIAGRWYRCERTLALHLQVGRQLARHDEHEHAGGAVTGRATGSDGRDPADAHPDQP